MIPAIRPSGQPPKWQRCLAEAVSDPAELLRLLELDPSLLPTARAAAKLFPLRVPRGFIARMRKSDRDDPLLRQVLPLAEELQPAPGYTTDPVGDLHAGLAPGVLQKYGGRALLVATGACAVHCRYCFRRHYPYGEENPRKHQWRATLDVLRQSKDINEVILSGGDPLSLSDAGLAQLARDLETIPHITRLRIHTRLPVVLPERVDEHLTNWLKVTGLQKVIIIHANHPNEINNEVKFALNRLADCGVTLLNQSVLLKGVNDSVTSLTELSEKLFDSNVLPYYLHMLDKVKGAAHFEVPKTRAKWLVRQLREHLPGFLVPLLVEEQAGAASKIPVEGAAR